MKHVTHTQILDDDTPVTVQTNPVNPSIISLTLGAPHSDAIHLTIPATVYSALRRAIADHTSPERTI